MGIKMLPSSVGYTRKVEVNSNIKKNKQEGWF